MDAPPSASGAYHACAPSLFAVPARHARSVTMPAQGRARGAGPACAIAGELVKSGFFCDGLLDRLLYQPYSFFSNLACIAEARDPMHIGLTAKPGCLALGIVAMALLRGGNRFVQCHGAIDHG